MRPRKYLHSGILDRPFKYFQFLERFYFLNVTFPNEGHMIFVTLFLFF